jgi:hypothetical protein
MLVMLAEAIKRPPYLILNPFAVGIKDADSPIFSAVLTFTVVR